MSYRSVVNGLSPINFAWDGVVDDVASNDWTATGATEDTVDTPGAGIPNTYSLDGVDDRISLPASFMANNLQGTNIFTFVWWVKLPSATFDEDDTHFGWKDALEVRHNNGDASLINMELNEAVDGDIDDATGVTDSGTDWLLLAAVYDGTNIMLYSTLSAGAAGSTVAQAASAAATANLAAGAGDLCVGCVDDGSVFEDHLQFQTTIPIIFDTALSVSDVQSIYDAKDDSDAQVDQTVQPTTVQSPVSIPGPTIQAGSNITVNPSTIDVPATIPAPTVVVVPAPTSPVATALSDTRATLSFEPPANGESFTYDLRANAVDVETDFFIPGEWLESDTPWQYTFTDLTPDTTYTLEVRTRSGSQVSDWATAADITTDADSPATSVQPQVETDEVNGDGDDADSAIVWLHPTDRSQSLVIGTSKDSTGGIHTFDLDGTEHQFLSLPDANAVDVLYGFPLGGETVDLIGVTDRNNNQVQFYTVDPATRNLSPAGTHGINVAEEIYGYCMARDVTNDAWYSIPNTKDTGVVEQYELDGSSGSVVASLVRTINVGGQTEGAYADPHLGHLFIGEEAEGVWRYDLDPSTGEARTQVDSTSSGTDLTDDVEGITIYFESETDGYIVVSSQGNSRFTVYDRAAPHAYQGSFQVVDNTSLGIGGAIDTDGLHANNRDLDATFPEGILVVHSSDTRGYRLCRWDHVADVLGLRAPDTSYDPRAYSVESVGTDATVEATTIDTAAAIPSPSVQTGGSATVAASVVATTAVVPTPAVGTGESETVTPSTVATATVISAPSITAESNDMATTTVGNLIDRIFRDWLDPPNDQPTRVILTSDLADDGDSFTYSSALIVPEHEFLVQGLVQIGREQILVGRADHATNTASELVRGVNGTEPQAHDAGALVTVRPTFTRQSVFDALRSAVTLLYPRLVRRETIPVTVGNGITEIPSDAIDAERFVYLDSGELRIAACRVLDVPGLAATGKVVQADAPDGTSGYLTYRARIEQPTSEDELLDADLGIKPEYEEALSAWVVSHVISGHELDAAMSEYLTRQLEAQNIPVGSYSSIRTSLIRHYEYLMRELSRYVEPLRVHNGWTVPE